MSLSLGEFFQNVTLFLNNHYKNISTKQQFKWFSTVPRVWQYFTWKTSVDRNLVEAGGSTPSGSHDCLFILFNPFIAFHPVVPAYETHWSRVVLFHCIFLIKDNTFNHGWTSFLFEQSPSFVVVPKLGLFSIPSWWFKDWHQNKIPYTQCPCGKLATKYIGHPLEPPSFASQALHGAFSLGTSLSHHTAPLFLAVQSRVFQCREELCFLQERGKNKSHM